MKVALVHYWLVSMRGGERVLESLCRMFPDADIYTHVIDKSRVSDEILRHQIRTTFISRLPFARKLYQKYLPFMPIALEQLDLSAYDLVISSESGPAKGIIPGPDTVHICYCHSPMRYIWDHYHVYRQQASWLTRILMTPLAHYLRIWDQSSSVRTDKYLANSNFIMKRIRKYYNRDAQLAWPPVAVDAFSPAHADDVGDYYLWAGQLVRYKRPDIMVEAFNRNKRKLIVIGEGDERKSLEKIAKDNITFLGAASFSDLKHHLSHCQALIFPGEEDFGIVPVEAQASGRPVIGYGHGGIMDTVIDGKTGILYPECSVDGLLKAIERFEASGLSKSCVADCVENASRFSERNFQAGVRRALLECGIDLGEPPMGEPSLPPT
ncbi:MAG: glycosyltransferase [Blastomonas sp.]|uniref:glycosyltransferase n=1 Tax=Blastomonas sp. TaxID=1909299 RepID=UPI00406A85E2|nr:glycosyltransferase [Blastomonas sp.]